jgi:hypothetical protein
MSPRQPLVPRYYFPEGGRSMAGFQKASGIVRSRLLMASLAIPINNANILLRPVHWANKGRLSQS